MTAEAPVAVTGLTKRYRGTVAVDGLDLTVRRGEVYGFLGPNGAGKTTTLRILTGLIAPTAGRVRVLGGAPGDPRILARTGSLVEAPAFYPYLSGRDNLRVLASYAGAPRSRVERVLADVDLADRAKDRFGTYSLGMKQRLGAAGLLPGFQAVADVLPGVNAGSLVGAVTAYAAGEPSPGVTDAVSGGRALVTVAAYALVFAVAAGAALRRRDVV